MADQHAPRAALGAVGVVGVGRVGAVLAAKLRSAGHEVVGVDNFWRGTRRNLESLETHHGFSFRHADIIADQYWFTDMGPDSVLIHTADIVAGIDYIFSNEWQVFRRITVPMLAPVLVVVLITLMINVMKIFDLVYIIASQPTQDEANVLALQLFLSSFGGGGNYGLGSAIGIILLLLVVPVMIVNIRRLRKERER